MKTFLKIIWILINWTNPLVSQISNVGGFGTGFLDVTRHVPSIPGYFDATTFGTQQYPNQLQPGPYSIDLTGASGMHASPIQTSLLLQQSGSFPNNNPDSAGSYLQKGHVQFNQMTHAILKTGATSIMNTDKLASTLPVLTESQNGPLVHQHAPDLSADHSKTNVKPLFGEKDSSSNDIPPIATKGYAQTSIIVDNSVKAGLPDNIKYGPVDNHLIDGVSKTEEDVSLADYFTTPPSAAQEHDLNQSSPDHLDEDHSEEDKHAEDYHEVPQHSHKSKGKQKSNNYDPAEHITQGKYEDDFRPSRPDPTPYVTTVRPYPVRTDLYGLHKGSQYKVPDKEYERGHDIESPEERGNPRKPKIQKQFEYESNGFSDSFEDTDYHDNNGYDHHNDGLQPEIKEHHEQHEDDHGAPSNDPPQQYNHGPSDYHSQGHQSNHHETYNGQSGLYEGNNDNNHFNNRPFNDPIDDHQTTDHHEQFNHGPPSGGHNGYGHQTQLNYDPDHDHVQEHDDHAEPTIDHHGHQDQPLEGKGQSFHNTKGKGPHPETNFPKSNTRTPNNFHRPGFHSGQPNHFKAQDEYTKRPSDHYLHGPHEQGHDFPEVGSHDESRPSITSYQKRPQDQHGRPHKQENDFHAPPYGHDFYKPKLPATEDREKFRPGFNQYGLPSGHRPYEDEHHVELNLDYRQNKPYNPNHDGRPYLNDDKGRPNRPFSDHYQSGSQNQPSTKLKPTEVLHQDENDEQPASGPHYDVIFRKPPPNYSPNGENALDYRPKPPHIRPQFNHRPVPPTDFPHRRTPIAIFSNFFRRPY